MTVCLLHFAGDVSVYPLADPSGVALDPRASYPVRLKGFRVTYCMPGTQSPQQSQQPTTQQQPRPPIIRRFRTLSQVPGGADALPPGVGEEEEEGLAYRSIQDDIPPTNRSGAIGRILSCAGRPLVAKTVVSSRGCFRHGRLVNGPGFPLLANTSALVYFVATGLYTVKVTTDAPASAWAVWSNGVLLPSVLGEAPLLVAEPGKPGVQGHLLSAVYGCVADVDQIGQRMLPVLVVYACVPSAPDNQPRSDRVACPSVPAHRLVPPGPGHLSPLPAL